MTHKEEEEEEEEEEGIGDLQEDGRTVVWWPRRIKPSVACNFDGSLPEVKVYERRAGVESAVDIALMMKVNYQLTVLK